MTEPFKNEQTAQSILHEWHSDLEAYAQTFSEQVRALFRAKVDGFVPETQDVNLGIFRQSILLEWHSDLEFYAQTFCEQGPPLFTRKMTDLYRRPSMST